MKTLLYAMLSLLLLGFGTAQAGYPAPFEAHYKIHKLGLDIARVDISLKKQADGSLLYRSETNPLGLLSLFRNDRIVETTELQNIRGQLRPLRFRHIHSGSKKNRDIDIVFDWDRHTASNRISGKEWTLEIPDDALDKFSLQVFMMKDLQEGRKTLDYKIADDGELDTYHFERLDHEKITVPAGSYDVLKLKRDHGSNKRKTVMWTAPTLHYLPVQVQHIEADGSNFYMKLEKVEINATPAVMPANTSQKESPAS
jgi:hypothetical protein